MKSNVPVTVIPKSVDQLLCKIFNFGREPECIIHCMASKFLDGASNAIISEARISVGKFDHLVLL